ncbi:hypothetical protein RDABS01_030819 [Bienertia sinuspersici]
MTEYKSRRNDEEDSEEGFPLKMKRKSKKKSSRNYVDDDDEDDEEEVPVKTKKASSRCESEGIKSLSQGEIMGNRLMMTKERRCISKPGRLQVNVRKTIYLREIIQEYKYKSKRVSNEDDDDDEEEECRLKSKKASSIKESRRDYEAEEEDEEEEEEGIGAGGRLLLVSPAQPNKNCRIESLGYTVMEFSETKRKWVEEIGFDGLFSLIGKGLTRNLCYWLMTRVDVPNRIFISVDGKEFPLTKVQVHWVLGLPIGPNVLPAGDEKGSLKEDVGRLWSKYSSKAPLGAAGISRKNVVDALLSDDVTEKEFKECFVMLALMDVLCPTTCHRMSSKLLPYVCCVVRARQYD